MISEEEAARRKRAQLGAYDGVPGAPGAGRVAMAMAQKVGAGNAVGSGGGVGGGSGGHAGGGAEDGKGMDIQEQIRRIREKYEQSGGGGGGGGQAS